MSGDNEVLEVEDLQAPVGAFSPWRQKRKRWNPRQKGTCEISQVVTCGSASFTVIYREAIEDFRVLERREPLLGTAIIESTHSAGPFPICHQGGECGSRVESFLNRWQAGCDLTPGATVSSRVSSIKQGIGDIDASFFFFLFYFYSNLGIYSVEKRRNILFSEKVWILAITKKWNNEISINIFIEL